MLVKAKGSLKERDAKKILEQISKGFAQLHSNRICHRDIKLANILLDFPEEANLLNLSYEQKMDFLKKVDLTKTPYTIKIADFGFAKFIMQDSQLNSTICGTPMYSSP